jgi:hypothetical protein
MGSHGWSVCIRFQSSPLLVKQLILELWLWPWLLPWKPNFPKSFFVHNLPYVCIHEALFFNLFGLLLLSLQFIISKRRILSLVSWRFRLVCYTKVHSPFSASSLNWSHFVLRYMIINICISDKDIPNFFVRKCGCRRLVPKGLLKTLVN